MKIVQAATLLFSLSVASAFIPRRHQASRPPMVLGASPEPLASEGDWTAYLDEESTGLVYYFNANTGESRWVPPTESFPPVTLPRSVKRKADEKQKEYRAAMAQAEMEQEKKGLLATLLEEPKKKVVEKKEEGDWFDFLKERKEPQSESRGSVVEKEQPRVEKKEEPDWLSYWFAPKEEPKTNGAVTVAEPVIEEPEVEEPVVEEAPPPAEPKKGLLDKVISAASKAVAEKPVEIETAPAPGEIKILAPDTSAYVLPDPKKLFWGGEDAVFVKGRTFGVFDGVSGAIKLDGVPLYSKTLATQMKKKVDGETGLDVKQIAKILGECVAYANEKATGASTALVGSIDETGFLRVLNVGDCTCMIIRDNKIVARTKEINHFYECPYQFSEISPDRPTDGTKMNFQLQKGDLLLAGSDGVFDNLNEDEILTVVLSSPKKASAIAKRISERSRKVSLNPRAVTPFSIAAKKNKNPDYPDGIGGKVDDVSCVAIRYE